MKSITKSRIYRRKRRVSANIHGTADRPRIVVFRSNRYIYLQAIDDTKRHTLAAKSSKDVKADKKQKKAEVAYIVGEQLAAVLIKKGAKKAVFDRSEYAYSGRVKASAEGLRHGGLQI